MKTLYKLDALNYYNEWRRNIIVCLELDWEGIADRLKYLHKAVQDLGITEGNEHYNDCQDLLNRIEISLDIAGSELSVH